MTGASGHLALRGLHPCPRPPSDPPRLTQNFLERGGPSSTGSRTRRHDTVNPEFCLRPNRHSESGRGRRGHTRVCGRPWGRHFAHLNPTLCLHTDPTATTALTWPARGRQGTCFLGHRPHKWVMCETHDHPSGGRGSEPPRRLTSGASGRGRFWKALEAFLRASAGRGLEGRAGLTGAVRRRRAPGPEDGGRRRRRPPRARTPALALQSA